MSLLLDARKKSKPAAQPETCAAARQAANQARNAGRNLFAAKPRMAGRTHSNRNPLYALGSAILLLAAGLAYSWHVNSSDNTPPHTASAPHARQLPPAAMAETMPNRPTPGAGNPVKSAAAAQPHSHTAAPPDSHIRIERQKTEAIDPLLEGAYLAYRDGRLDEARQLYLARLAKDARDPDALLGLAAIAQQHGENQTAAQYFGRVLALDPRNAEANAGMSALSADGDYAESRLKILLREQGNSAVLHFALGNLYAGQARWGEAQQAFFNAYTLEPGNAEYAFNLAVSLDHLGQVKLAAQQYRRAMQLDPSHSAGFDHAQISLRAQELTGIARSLP